MLPGRSWPHGCGHGVTGSGQSPRWSTANPTRPSGCQVVPQKDAERDFWGWLGSAGGRAGVRSRGREARGVRRGGRGARREMAAAPPEGGEGRGAPRGASGEGGSGEEGREGGREVGEGGKPGGRSEAPGGRRDRGAAAGVAPRAGGRPSPRGDPGVAARPRSVPRGGAAPAPPFPPHTPLLLSPSSGGEEIAF